MKLIIASLFLTACGSAENSPVAAPELPPVVMATPAPTVVPTATPNPLFAPSLPTPEPVAYYPSIEEQQAHLSACRNDCESTETGKCNARAFNPQCVRQVPQKCNLACAQVQSDWLATFQ